ncbi:hypothetical protein B0T10DRAFT_501482 [Thelonectria olida]|uniref:Rhodopsin domain-containing protein n=1 Tax=Thelonectria olida TaxID=1576542 RepID=A0A9P8VQD8_9HYPO|nr:hypothetical protein B0T10DRAFT_501482 [Thelonectria olida]
MSTNSEAAPPFYLFTDDNHSALVVVASLVFLIYAVLGMLTKLLIRLNITSLKDYDFTLLAGLFLYFVQTACIIAACRNGLGQHRDAISEADFLRFSKLIYAARILSLFVAGCTKISLCLLIRQIDNQGRLNMANLALGGIVLVWVATGFFATIFQCPLPSPWVANSNDECPNYGPIFLYNGIMDILTDLALCVLPVAMMWHVQTTLRRKIIVMSLFGTRIIVPIVTIPSLSNANYLFRDYSDPTWLTLSSTIWFQVSLGLSVLTVCIPSLKGVIDSLLGSTSVAAIQMPYELKDSGGRSGLQPTMLGDSSSSKQASRDVSRPGMLNSKGKSPENSTWYPEREVRAKHGGGGSLSGSESVRKLTEGVIVVRDEFEISYDDRRASTSRAGSRESADAGYRRVEHI